MNIDENDRFGGTLKWDFWRSCAFQNQNRRSCAQLDELQHSPCPKESHSLYPEESLVDPQKGPRCHGSGLSGWPWQRKAVYQSHFQ